MNFDQLIRNDQIVQLLSQAVIGSLDNIEHVPDMVKEVINNEMWRERRIVQTGEVVRFERFIDFVTAKPLEGLGTNIPTLERLCREDLDALDMLDKIQKEIYPHGGDHKSENIKLYNVQLEKKRYAPTGNTRTRALRQLREHRPTPPFVAKWTIRRTAPQVPRERLRTMPPQFFWGDYGILIP